MKLYLTPKEIERRFGITKDRIKYARKLGRLKDIKWTGEPDKSKRTYHVEEVVEEFGIDIDFNKRGKMYAKS